MCTNLVTTYGVVTPWRESYDVLRFLLEYVLFNQIFFDADANFWTTYIFMFIMFHIICAISINIYPIKYLTKNKNNWCRILLYYIF